MNQSITTRVANVLAWIFVFIIVILPFHEFLTTWLGSNFGHLDLFRSWKEIVLALCTPPTLFLIYSSKKLRHWIFHDWLIRLIFLYILVVILSGAWAFETHRVNAAALSDGLIIDLRFLVFFGMTAVVTHYTKLMKKHWLSITVWPGLTAILLGISQLFLPYDFLRHFGYGPKTIPAYSTIDQKIQYRRIQSTLRGANPFGAYLVLVIPAVLAFFKDKLWLKLTCLGGALVALFFTYSRSAWLGLVVTLVLFTYFVWLKPTWRRKFIIAGLVGAIVLGGLVVGLRYNHVAENLFFHTDNTSKAQISSNSQRLSGVTAAFKQVAKNPLGGGTGSAGPASEHNDHPARIAENYYLQVGQEVGWLGMALFIAINIIVGLRLYRLRRDSLAIVLLVSLAGISIVNLLSHAWADDTLSLLWWGLAGVMLTPVIMKKRKRY